ncbi:tight junction-associated protein 1 [Holotrichia oblita]|uniref:Tight junction-associated protein 1 n=1 Tax=Holotrichia oblita TaxID=644536 RepID=A0ACB9TUM5_HOLOL|nr:tight junction-associated protein 1 [Holotrichia oblita]
MANSKCKECGCRCSKCVSTDHDVHLHVEIENLKQKLVERDNHIVSMETNFLNEANKYPSGEANALREELLTWQDKYRRLYEAHRRVQRVNQGLEDKLLKLVDTCETDKSTLTKDVAVLSHKLAEANYSIKKLTEDNLPNEVQAKVSSYLAGKRKPEERKTPPEIKSIKVPIPTFPPTAMVYSIPKSPNASKKSEKDVESGPVDIVSAAIMAKILEEREKERANVKHCDTCTCAKNIKIINQYNQVTVSTQTISYRNWTCFKCSAIIDQSYNNNKSEETKHKTIPVYIHDYDCNNTNQNIAKVQPNNFLTERNISNEVKHISRDASEVSRNIHVDSSLQLSTYSNKCDVEVIREKAANKGENLHGTVHHQLCNFNTPDCEVNSNMSKSMSDNMIETVTGPRYCSMKVQNSSRNILLDSTNGNIAPVVYTRHQDKKTKIEKACENESLYSEDIKTSVATDTSFQNQRVAEWIENNIEDSDNSRSDSSKAYEAVDAVNKERYLEMENNVKRFLFGETEFMKTVEIGKKKYESYAESDSNKRGSRSNSHTETEI